MANIQYVTKEGLDKLRSELEHLESVERPKISQQIAEARDKGDLSENAEYDAAKEDPYAIKKKVVKGGSWKDIGRNIRGDMREGEFQNQPRSYIGFRCVRTQVGFAKSKK